MSPVLPILSAILETDPNWQRPAMGVTRRFIISATLLSIAGICVLLIVVPIMYALVAPTPFEYRNLPFEVCAPGSTNTDCREFNAGDVFQPGDVVPFVADRCATEVFARSAVLPYVVSRNVVNADTGTRIILPSLSTETPTGGCQRAISVAHQLPESIAPGHYYFEGVATVYGQFRTVNAYFRTKTFTVGKPS